jgi:hypothetical protein
MMASTLKLTVATLDANALYLSPSGKTCRWVMMPANSGDRLFFAYTGSSATSLDTGFTLSSENVRLLRRVA